MDEVFKSSSHWSTEKFFLLMLILGIAGASYIPTVQAALPRLLGAAAPPGAGARENRRQCHKVLVFTSVFRSLGFVPQ